MNLNIRSLFFILMYCAASLKVTAQKTEFGFLAGGSYYYGDIVNTNFQPKTVGPGFGVLIRYHYNKRIALRGNLMYCRVQGADSNLVFRADTKWQKTRNLAFYSDILEVSGTVEYSLIEDANKSRRMHNRVIPYVFGGIGIFYFDPMAISPVSGKPIALRPLMLGGESYLPVAVAFPLGVGIRCYITKNWQVGVELGMRVTTTSNLDDIEGSSTYPDPATLPNDNARIMSVRNVNSVNTETQMADNFTGKPRGKIDYISDLYFIGGVTVSYRLWPKGARTYQGMAIRCPRFY
ncbi:MAG: DUF6089 family protein [Bacteroidota bacterium]